jgi:HSP20 family protein
MAEIMIFTADQSDAPAAQEEELPPLAFEMAETKDFIQLTADVSGFDDDEIEVTLGDGELTVAGYHEEDEDGEANDDEEEADVLGFTQSFTVPEGTRASQIEADIEDGVLTIVIAKSSAESTVQ